MSFKIHWLKEKKKAVKRGEQLVYEEQRIVGKQILDLFSQKVLVTLCAPPQWGKTGVSLYVAYHMCLMGTNPQNVFFITGMSDRSWLDQTRERMLPCWKQNVYHRNTLHKMRDKILDLDKRRDILLIVDECHLANKTDFILGQIFEELSLNDPLRLKMKNIKILQISATPSNALMDAEEWSSYHGRITPRMNDGYVSFQRFILEERVRETKNLGDLEECEEYIEEVTEGSPQYHFVRSVSNGLSGSLSYKQISSNFNALCKKENHLLIEMNMEKTSGEIKKFYENLSKQPSEHTFILIKNMLGASKTIDDSFIGSVHESTPLVKDYSSEVQGLPGRLCGWTKRKTNGPILYCSQEILEEYIKLYESGFDFESEGLVWSDSRLKVSETRGIKVKPSYIRNELDLESSDSSEGSEDSISSI